MKIQITESRFREIRVETLAALLAAAQLHGELGYAQDVPLDTASLHSQLCDWLKSFDIETWSNAAKQAASDLEFERQRQAAEGASR